MTSSTAFRIALFVLGAATAVVEALSNLPKLDSSAVITAIATTAMGYAVRYHADVAAKAQQTKVQTSAPDKPVAQMAPTPDDE